MMGVGIDIVENERVRKALSPAFLRHVLSKEEIARSKEYTEKRMVEFVSGRFACKEAIIKALSGYDSPVMSELNIINNETGKPEIKYKNYRLLISISHERNYACAMAILEGVENG